MKLIKANSRFHSRKIRSMNASYKRLKSHLAHLLNNQPKNISSQWTSDFISTSIKIQEIKKKIIKSNSCRLAQDGPLLVKSLVDFSCQLTSNAQLITQ